MTELMAVVDNLDLVDEPDRKHYRLTEQGVHELKLNKESIKTHSVNAGLVSALAKERKAREEAQKIAADSAKTIEELGDLTQLREMKDKFDSAEMVPKSELEALKQMELAKIQADIDKERRETAEALKEAQDQAATAIRDKNSHMLKSELTATFAKSGVQDYAIEDALAHSLKFWQIEDGKPVAKTEAGLPMPGDGEKPLDMSTWARRLEKTKPHYFQPAIGGGANGLKGGGQKPELTNLTGMALAAEARKQMATT